jgi:hypothetical protein
MEQTLMWKNDTGQWSAAGLQALPLDGAAAERRFSIRDEAAGQPLAVLSLSRREDGRWKAAGLTGPAERPVDDLLVRLFASCVALEYDRANRELPANVICLAEARARRGTHALSHRQP